MTPPKQRMTLGQRAARARRTKARRRLGGQLDALRFLVEDFGDVPEVFDPRSTTGLQHEAAQFGLGIELMVPEELHRLRLFTRDWLRSVVRDLRLSRRVRFPAGVSLTFVPADDQPPTMSAKDLRDVFWWHVVSLISAGGGSEIRVCYAPRPRPKGQVGAGARVQACGRLFLRRGEARKFCSERCRVRVATQRARGSELRMPRTFEGWDFETAANLMDVSSRDDRSSSGWVFRTPDDADAERPPEDGRQKTRRRKPPMKGKRRPRTKRGRENKR